MPDDNGTPKDAAADTTAPKAEQPFASLGEGLFAGSTIRLFGRPFAGLILGDDGVSPTSNNPLAQALLNKDRQPGLARIYGFSYLGNYFKLAEPLVFLVYGKGVDVKSGTTTPDNPLSLVGIEFKYEEFTEGVRMWSADQLDISVRIDITIGWMKDILLAQEMGSDNNMTGGDSVRRSDIVGRDGNLVGRDGNLVGRDGNLIGGPPRR